MGFGEKSNCRRDVGASQEQLEATYFGRIAELEKELEDRKHVEADLRTQIEEFGNTLIEKEKLEATLHGHIKDLEKEMQERDAYKQQLETSLHGQIKELQKKARETYCDSVSAEFKLRCKISELVEELEETHRDKMEAEDAFRAQREYYEGKRQAVQAIYEQVLNAVRSIGNRMQQELQERDIAARKLKATIHRMRIGHAGEVKKLLAMGAVAAVTGLVVGWWFL